MKLHTIFSLLLLSTIGFAPVAIAQNYVPQRSAQFYGDTPQLDAEIDELLRIANNEITESNQWQEENDANIFYHNAETAYQFTESSSQIYHHSERSYRVTTTYSDEPSENTYRSRPMPHRRRHVEEPRPSSSWQQTQPSSNHSQISYRVPDPEPSVVSNVPKAAASEPSNAVSSATYYALLTDEENVLYTMFYKAASQRQASVKLAGDIDNTNVSRVLKSIIYDHPELIWITNGFSKEMTYSHDQVKETEVFFKYNDLAESADQAIQELERAAAKILAEAEQYNTIEEREKYVHDVLNRSVTYMHSTYDQTAYGALVSQQSVCAGISRAFKYLLDRLDIPSYVVSGQLYVDGTPGNHAWNLVVINGRCYNVDVTSDEVTVRQGNQKYTKVDDRLFNKSDSEFQSRGYVRESEYSDKAVKLPECR